VVDPVLIFINYVQWSHNMEKGINMTNPRIKELAKQAGLYFYVNGKLYPQTLSAEESCVAYERFAELIVKDCQRIGE